MLAYLKSETGGDLVRDVLADPDRDVPVYAHAVNTRSICAKSFTIFCAWAARHWPSRSWPT